MPQYILILEAVLVPGLDGALVIGKVEGDLYIYKSNINIHAFALKQLESRAAIEGDGYGGLRGTYFAERRIQAAVGAMHGG